MKSNDLVEVPRIPVVVESLMTCAWAHFANARAERVCVCPARLYFLSTCPSSARHVTHAEVALAIWAVAIDMPTGDCDVDTSMGVKPQVGGEFLVALPKALRVLTADVRCDDNPGKFGACKRRQNNIIDIAIPIATTAQLARSVKLEKTRYRSPFCKSPTPFLRTRLCRPHKQRTAPVAEYPGVHRTAARTIASCSE
jgi:hypothetical protein